MAKAIILIIALFITFQLNAQRIYWVSDVMDFSSELSSKEYSARQIIGKPNVLPQGGDNPNAWMPSKPNKLEYITVAFEKAVSVQQIVIAESYNPSALYQIYFYDRKGNEYLVHTFDPKPVSLKSRLLRINIQKTDYEVQSMRLVIDGRKVPGYFAIDAIGVSPSNKPIVVEIEQPQNLRENIVVERLGENVNSAFPETRPLISPDGKTLYFSRSNHPENLGGIKDPNDIWYSEMNETTGEWEKAKNLGEPLNNKGPNFISSITPDGNSMMVLLGNEYPDKGNKMKPGVSMSTKTSDGWSKPQALDIINANIETMDGNYFMASNRKVLIMAVDRMDSYGGKDLYVSFLQQDGKWTEPLNLGNDINTASDEDSPYLAADNETLYFSSGGYSGYGGSDVYISRRLDDTWTNWTEPENLGPDINSEGNDVFFNIPPSGQFAYYSRDMADGNGDIYKIAMPVFYQPSPVVSISGRVTDSTSNMPLPAKISYTLMPENTNVGFTVSDTLTGEYEILLPVGSAYGFIAMADGYESKTERIDLKEEMDFMELERNISLKRDRPASQSELDELMVKGFISGAEQKLVLGSAVLFDVGSDKLRPASFGMLDKLVEFMREDREAKLIIGGHTDNAGTDEYNQRLSRQRAQSVRNYFVKGGIDARRFEAIGYGATQPIVSNDTEEGKSQNRRVELILHK